jgi:hypothetical protein
MEIGAGMRLFSVINAVVQRSCHKDSLASVQSDEGSGFGS